MYLRNPAGSRWRPPLRGSPVKEQAGARLLRSTVLKPRLDALPEGLNERCLAREILSQGTFGLRAGAVVEDTFQCLDPGPRRLNRTARCAHLMLNKVYHSFLRGMVTYVGKGGCIDDYVQQPPATAAAAPSSSSSSSRQLHQQQTPAAAAAAADPSINQQQQPPAAAAAPSINSSSPKQQQQTPPASAAAPNSSSPQQQQPPAAAAAAPSSSSSSSCSRNCQN